MLQKFVYDQTKKKCVRLSLARNFISPPTRPKKKEKKRIERKLRCNWRLDLFAQSDFGCCSPYEMLCHIKIHSLTCTPCHWFFKQNVIWFGKTFIRRNLLLSYIALFSLVHCSYSLLSFSTHDILTHLPSLFRSLSMSICYVFSDFAISSAFGVSIFLFFIFPSIWYIFLSHKMCSSAIP